nr:MAG TPA: hypothetical protein [Caudoviricetes sp.]
MRRGQTRHMTPLRFCTICALQPPMAIDSTMFAS